MTVAAAQPPDRGFQLKGAGRVQAGRASVAEAQECLGEMLVELGVVESEASRFVAASSVHVALRDRGHTPGLVAVAEGS